MLARKHYPESLGHLSRFQNASCNLWYADVGKRSGDAGQQTVLCLHGIMQSSSNFGPRDADLVGPLVEMGFRVICPDNYGCGLSDTPVGEENYGIDKTVDDVVRLLDSLGIDRVHLVGHSYGTTAGILLVVSHPARVQSFVAASNGWMDYESGVKVVDSAYGMFCCLRACSCPFSLLMRALTGEPMNPYGAWMTVAAHKNPDIPTWDLDKLRAIKIPVLGIVGAKDELMTGMSMVPVAEALQGVVPDHRLQIIEGKGHVDILKDPSFKEAVLEFIKRNAGKGGGYSAPAQRSMEHSPVKKTQ